MLPRQSPSFRVIAGLVPAISLGRVRASLSEMAGTSPAMTRPRDYGLSPPAPSPARRRDVDEAQLHTLLPVPPIHGKRAGGMNDAAAMGEKRGAELLPGGAERDGVDGRAVARAQARAQVRGACLLHIDELMAGQGQNRLRIAGPE